MMVSINNSQISIKINITFSLKSSRDKKEHKAQNLKSLWVAESNFIKTFKELSIQRTQFKMIHKVLICREDK
jgi:hypothetical protein